MKQEGVIILTQFYGFHTPAAPLTKCIFFTLDPVIDFLVSMVMVVKDVVKVAVKIDTIHIPRRIQNTANVRPRNDRGDLSPYLSDADQNILIHNSFKLVKTKSQFSAYPTVVMETNAHQNPSHDPLIKVRGNCSGLVLISCK